MNGPTTPPVTGVYAGPGRRLALEFADGTRGIVDVSAHLSGSAFELVRDDPTVFAGVHLGPGGGTVVWPGGATIAAGALYDAAVRSARTPHDPRTEPQDRADASLMELAGAKLSAQERQETLDHGLAAVRELGRQVAQARLWARAAYHEWYDKALVERDNPPDWLTAGLPVADQWAHRRLEADRAAQAPAGRVMAHRTDGNKDVTFAVGDRVLLGDDAAENVPAAVAGTHGDDVLVVPLGAGFPVVEASLTGVDDTGMPWGFVDEAAVPRGLEPGAVVRVVDGPRVRAWAQVADVTQEAAGMVAHLRVLPVIITDDSLPVDVHGVSAWSTDEGNERLGHPLAVGDLVSERDGGDPPGTGLPARVASVESDPDWPGGWRYRLLPVIVLARDAAYGARPGTDKGGNA